MGDENIACSDVPDEALRKARRALTEHASAFWTRHPGAPLKDRAQVELVIRRLRENGDMTAWRTARAIEECL